MARGYKAKKTRRYTKDDYIDYAKNAQSLRGTHEAYFNHQNQIIVVAAEKNPLVKNMGGFFCG